MGGQDMQQKNKKEIWMLYTKKADFHGLAARLGVSPVSVRIMRNRGIETEEGMHQYLYGTPEDMYDGRLMRDMEKAAGLLMEKIRSGKRIRIIGDYDIDGVCSTYLLYTGLNRVCREIEKKQRAYSENSIIDYEIPDRIRDGYGINMSIIRQAEKDQIDTIITCDNGIAAASEIAEAKRAKMTVIVTDHHEVPIGASGQVLPMADAIVNPKQEGDAYPFKEICGAVVVYKLLETLYEYAGIPKAEWKELLEFAAIATVGDVMRLQDENRLIVKYGLKQIAATKNLGLRKLIEKNDLDPASLSAYHIGFVIGPCLNAGGRLQTAKLALQLLLADSDEKAEQLAEQLKALNDIRKDMTKAGEEAAIRQVEEKYSSDRVLVVYLPECHESLAGIIAGRVREYFHKPAIVLTDGEQIVKGSGRSIEQYHMFKGLTEVAELLPKFGGHPMAAGLSIEKKDIDEFRRRLNENAKLTEEDFIPKLWIDVPMPLEYVSEQVVEELKLLEPFGQGNEKPKFAQKGITIRSTRILGRNRNAVRLSLVTESGFTMDGLWFGDADRFMEELDGKNTIDIIYYPDVNEYNGTKTLQAIILYFN